MPERYPQGTRLGAEPRFNPAATLAEMEYPSFILEREAYRFLKLVKIEWHRRVAPAVNAVKQIVEAIAVPDQHCEPDGAVFQMEPQERTLLAERPAERADLSLDPEAGR